MKENRVLISKGRISIENDDIFINEFEGVMLLLQHSNAGLLNMTRDDSSWNLSEYLEGVLNNRRCDITVKYVKSSTAYDIVNPFTVKKLWDSNGEDEKFIHAGSFEIGADSTDIIGEFNHNISCTFSELNPYYYIEIYLE